MTVEFDGFTVRGAEDGPWDWSDSRTFVGGGLYAREADITVRNCVFTRNAEEALSTFRGAPVVEDCVFVENEAFVGGAAVNHTQNEASVGNSWFVDNAGGGMYTESSRPITDCVFLGNKGIGGLRIGDGHPRVLRCTFANNAATWYGGGMSTRAYTEIVNCGFFGNTAGVSSGALNSSALAPLLVINSVFSGNRAGGFANWPDFDAAPGTGGAIESGASATVVLGSVFVGNHAGIVGGLSSFGGVVANSIFWGNTDDSEDVENGQVGVQAIEPPGYQYNDIQGWSERLPGYGNISIEPRFVDVDGRDQVAGTEDDDFHLAEDSPLINAGDPVPPLAPGFDLDGHPRRLCGRIDIGAFEFGIGDYNCDQVVRIGDFTGWPACASSPGTFPYHSDSCRAFDFDGDYDVDLKDFAGFSRLLRRPSS